MTRNTIFKGAYDILKKNKIKKIIESQVNGTFYDVKGSTNTYSNRIYLKTASWFQQCGCRVGVTNKPWGLCKHSIATIVTHFLEENNLKLVKNIKLEQK